LCHFHDHCHDNSICPHHAKFDGTIPIQVTAFDVLIPKGSRIDTGKIVFMKDLAEGFITRRLPIANTLEELLHPDPIRASESLMRITNLALRRFQKFCRYKQESVIRLNNGSYEYRDTYTEYYHGRPVELELIPVTIANVGGTFFKFVSAYWEYRRPIFYMGAGEQIIRAFCDWPFYRVKADDGKYTEDTHIYGMVQREQDWFTDVFDLEVLRALKSRTHLINLPFSMDFLSLDFDIQELTEVVSSHEAACTDFSWGWR